MLSCISFFLFVSRFVSCIVGVFTLSIVHMASSILDWVLSQAYWVGIIFHSLLCMGNLVVLYAFWSSLVAQLPWTLVLSSLQILTTKFNSLLCTVPLLDFEMHAKPSLRHYQSMFPWFFLARQHQYLWELSLIDILCMSLLFLNEEFRTLWCYCILQFFIVLLLCKYNETF